MIKAILILLVIHYIGAFVFKPNKNILGCGLFSWSGLKVKAFNRYKFDILGILNISRGKHSCGIQIDGDIFVGTDDTKVYTDFIGKDRYELPQRYPVVLGHTRHATGGAHNKTNAHPFGFGSSKNNPEDFAFIGVHNGSLVNADDLAEEYDIISRVYDKDGKWVRNKIDSEILLEILYRTGNFKVLSKYLGAAALKWFYTDEPDVVYYYHGKSDDDNSSNPILKEERPLYYLKEGKNSLYASSLKDSLLAINGDKDKVGEFEHNTVYKVTNGDIENAKKFKISRKGMYQKQTYAGKRNGRTNTTSQGTDTTSTSVKPSNKSACSNEVNIYNEKPVLDLNKMGSRIYFNKLRYSRNGHQIDGYHVYIENFGFYKVGENLKDAESTFWRIVGMPFLKGTFTNFKNMDDEEVNMCWVPFQNTEKNPITNPPLHIFYKGIRIETARDYEACHEMEFIGKEFGIPELSLIAKHPIMDDTYMTRPANTQNIYLDGSLYTGKICPLGADKIYEIEKGNLIGLQKVEQNPEIISSLSLVKETEEEDDTKQTNLDGDFIDDYLDTTFDSTVSKLKYHKKQLMKYRSKNDKADKAIQIIDKFITDVHNLKVIEEKE